MADFQNPVRAVFFDLDDTLFDLRNCRRMGLAAIQPHCPLYREQPLDLFDQFYLNLLDDLQFKVSTGVLSIQEAKAERMRRLMGMDAPSAMAEDIISRYQRAFDDAAEAVPGAVALLAALRPKATIVVVTNNLLTDARRKIFDAGLRNQIDEMVVSEQVGAEKPDRRIFEVAMQRADVDASQAVMVGDSWHHDVLGAQACGIRAVWFNRWNAPHPGPQNAPAIASYEPLATACATILETA